MSAIVLNEVDPKKRRTLVIATSVVGAVGAASVAVPFIFSMNPSARAIAAGAAVQIDLAPIEPGQQLTFEYRGAPHWIVRRTPEMIAQLEKNDALLADPKSEGSKQPGYAKNAARAIKPEWLVLKGVCTHLGCSPIARFTPGAQPSLPDDWPGGFLCPCHGSTFDLAGRVYKNKPAPDNLPVPPYKFLSDSKLVIGEETKA